MFDWIVSFVRSSGYFGIAFLMLAENVFPPIPSELIMPLAGFTAARGELSLGLIILAGTTGSLAGVTFWYWLGAKLGAERLKQFSDRHGRWLTMSREDIDRANDWFSRYGSGAVLLGRLVPTVRTLISVPAGVSSMSFGRFLFFSAIGTLIGTSLLALAGYWLQSSYEKVEEWVGPASNIIVAAFAIGYLYRVVTFEQTPEA